jgi:rare lipoprotein A
MIKRLSIIIALTGLLTQFVGCYSPGTPHVTTTQVDGPPSFNIDASKIPDAEPKAEPRSSYGNPPSYVVYGKRYHVLKSSENYVERGIASWYGTKFHAKRTSSGEPYSMLTMTAAHKSLPLPTYAEVTNLSNHRKVIVKINDRGPFRDNRIIDLSYVAAKKLGITATGTGLVEVRAINPRQYKALVTEPVPMIVAVKQSTSPRLYLQIGAFSKRENADQLSNQILHFAKAPVSIHSTVRNNKTLYRVQIGPIVSVDRSDILHQELKQRGLGDPVTVIQ